MAHPVRPFVGTQSASTSRMVPPGVSANPSMIPVMQGSFNYGAPTISYVPQAVYHTQPFQASMVNAIPAQMTGMYVPVAPVNSRIGSSHVDPSKILEEQKRLEKERNFQMQQQRLKQFTVGGKKGVNSLKADTLIDNMFGKVQPKPYCSNLSPIPSFSETVNPPKQVFPPVYTPPVSALQPESVSFEAKAEKSDKKGLDAMMQECSDFSVPQRAHKFIKPTVKDITPLAQQKHTFASSQKARDWKTLQGLDEVFVVKKPRLPEWCTSGNVPETLKQVAAVVTGNGTHPPDTKLLFPVLVSSGLPQQTLGQIWEIVNHSSPGQLTIEEMYAALALVAVVQAGHPVKSIDVLHQLPACPSPHLQCFASPPVASEAQNESSPPAEEVPAQEIAPVEPKSHLVIRPTAISLKNVHNPVNFCTENQMGDIASPGFSSAVSPDDDFDDFKSATPTAVNFSLMTPPSDPVPTIDDFADFQQAPPPVTDPHSMSTPIEQDLMSPDEDKYSAFRSLQVSDDPEEWAGFSSASSQKPIGSEASAPVDKQPNPSVVVTDTLDLFGSETAPNVTIAKEDDDFGDFLQAQAPNPPGLGSQKGHFHANFADFANFQNSEFQPQQQQQTAVVQLDDEFGDFSSGICPAQSKLPDLVGSDFVFQQLRDNVSLAESQSVSSLELGTFDGGGHSGESKSSLSRQGSIPSLDLKSTYPEGVESEDFGEFQSPLATSRSSKSPSPAKDVKIVDNGIATHSLGLNFQSSRTVPLTDKYSVIRSEEQKVEDVHISCWTRCLQSSVNILNNTQKVFNQMSCSSVCNEVLRTEEGENYIKDVVEVYKVVRRIAAASKSSNKQNTPMCDLLRDADQAWITICGFLAGSSVMPEDASLEFSNAVLNSNSEDNAKACGLCLLNTEIKNRLAGKEETLNLSYGGRNYHSACANLWVNCVDPLLPGLTLPQLL